MKTTTTVGAERIRAERGTATLEEFAARLGYGEHGQPKLAAGVRTIQRWERGMRPRSAGLRRLTRATGKTASFLLGEAEEEASLVAALYAVIAEYEARKEMVA